jgi:hypothetical protein
MLVDDNDRFITQRSVHELALFKLSFTDEGFLVSYKGSSIELPLTPSKIHDPITVTIWDDNVQACELGEEFNNWFSQHLNISCRLVFFPEANERMVDRNYVSGGEQVSFADGYPYLIIGKGSLDDLNSKLKDPVPMNRFRPNFIFEGTEAYEEDKWVSFTIGANRFTGVKLCGRCVLLTVNQETGESGVEPLATLSKYRKVGSKVNFGQNLIPVDFNQVNEGDPIVVESFNS